jgi:hypothetical protein
VLAEKAFFSFASILDPARHLLYNQWHQLDHRPENLSLDGVRYGERWVLSPDCAAVGRIDEPRLSGTHYINTYWFREPAAASIAEWQTLAERSFQWGRRPESEWAARPLMGFFSTVKGYVSPRVRVSADALPFRPNRGVHVTVSRLTDPHSASTGQLFAWYDQVWIPDLLQRPGVAGVWTFSSDSTTLDPSWRPVPGSTTFNASGSDQGSIRILLVYLDEDPVELCPQLTDRAETAAARDRPGNAADLEATLFAAPLRVINPWEWDWFSEPGTG